MKKSVWRIQKLSVFDMVALAFNICVIVFAVWQSWGVGKVMFLYWFQGIVYGFFQMKMIGQAKNFSTRGISSGQENIDKGVSLPHTTEGKLQAIGLFFLPYYIFHFIVLILMLFLTLAIAEGSMSSSFSTRDVFLFLLILVGICIEEKIGQVERKKRFEQRGNHLAAMIVLPFVRVLPLYVTFAIAIIPAMFIHSNSVVLIAFMLTKTYFDMIATNFEERVYHTLKTKYGFKG